MRTNACYSCVEMRQLQDGTTHVRVSIRWVIAVENAEIMCRCGDFAICLSLCVRGVRRICNEVCDPELMSNSKLHSLFCNGSVCWTNYFCCLSCHLPFFWSLQLGLVECLIGALLTLEEAALQMIFVFKCLVDNTYLPTEQEYKSEYK